MTTLYLTNLASLRSEGHPGPGRVWAAMALPPAYVVKSTHGTFPGGTPKREELKAVLAGDLAPEPYLTICRARFEERSLCGIYAPSRIRGKQWESRTWEPLLDGDTIVCTCPRPDSDGRTHRCHIEELAPALLAAGWGVVLYGERL